MKALDELVFPETERLAKETWGSGWTLLRAYASMYEIGVAGIFHFDAMR